MKLSILICTLPTRMDKLFNLLNTLIPQTHFKPVEVLYLGDTKTMSIGKKRNHLVSISSGEYVVFIDDDDNISSEYVDSILEATEYGHDCITIGGYYTKNGDKLTRAEFNVTQKVGKNHHARNLQDKKMYHHMLPNHLCAWKREVALRVEFPDKSLGEDHQWAEKQHLLGYSEFHIDKKLYHYDFNLNSTETSRRR